MTRLREALRSRQESLLKDTESLIGKATPHLWHTWSTFQTGTKHTPEHTDTVEKIAGLLLSDEIIAAMTDDEIAMLILACHFHDLGMAGTEADNATIEGRDRVRKEHAISIGEKIRTRWQEFGFRNQNYAEILAEICRGHRPDKMGGAANWDSLSEHRNIGPSRFVRLRLVSAMIYAADELHLGDDRAPKREEEWKEVTTAESLRHWRRHQAVSGPTRPIRSICFDVRINTFRFEEDLRIVFKKALLSVADLRRELSSIGMADSLPEIQLQWLRDELWKLLITHVCSDGTPRSQDDIRNQVLLEFKNSQTKWADVSDLCSEQPADDSGLNVQIERAISDFVTQEFLVADTDPASYRLAFDFRSARYLLTLTSDADKTERLFGRTIDASHEQSFYASETGKRFIRECIFPEIKASYAVDIAKMPENTSLRTVIESSPTACRFLRQISAPPGTLVKRDLLQVATTAGICFDLMNNPELFLDKPLRMAIREIFVGTAERLPRFMNLIQELAIIQNLSFDQISEIVTPSASLRGELNGINDDKVTVNVSQEFPRERPDWALPYLVLAGQRAQEPITILNSQDAPLRISVESNDEAVSRLNQEEPVSISFAPTMGEISSAITLRASVSLDVSQRLLKFTCYKLKPNLQDELPVIVTLPSRPMGDTANITFSFVQTALSVGQLLDLQRASELSSAGNLKIQLQVDSVGQFGCVSYSGTNPFPVPVELPIECLVALASIDREMPVPLVAAKGLLERVIEATPEARPKEFEAIKAIRKENKPTVTSITLRLATADGLDYREEVLGYLPMGMYFSAPQLTNGEMPQDEVDLLIESGETFWKIETSFREDAHELAKELRQWMRDPTQPFPFHGDEDLQFHYCKTRMERQHLIHIDRFWYIERPVVFRFCPATKAEQYRIEMDYWRNKGDDRRAELLKELIEEAKKNADSSSEADRAAPQAEPPTELQ